MKKSIKQLILIQEDDSHNNGFSVYPTSIFNMKEIIYNESRTIMIINYENNI